MSRISRAVATRFVRRFIEKGDYQQRVFEDKDDFINRIEGLFGRQPNVLFRARARRRQDDRSTVFPT